MELPLKEQDVLALSKIHRGTKDKRVADKLKCIKLLDQGHEQSFIAQLLEVDEKTVFNWKKKFLESRDFQQILTSQSGNHTGKLDTFKKTPL